MRSFIALVPTAQPIFRKAGLTKADKGFVNLNGPGDVPGFIEACRALVLRDREPKVAKSFDMNDMTYIVERQRAVQQQVQKADKARPPEEMKGAMQAGARRYPEPPFPNQLLEKPGDRRRPELSVPRTRRPSGRGSGKLEGKKAIITGGDSGIGRAVAVLFAREGADVAILHLAEEQEDAPTSRAPRS